MNLKGSSSCVARSSSPSIIAEMTEIAAHDGQHGPPGSLRAIGGAVRDDTKGEQQQPDEGSTGAEEGHAYSRTAQ